MPADCLATPATPTHSQHGHTVVSSSDGIRNTVFTRGPHRSSVLGSSYIATCDALAIADCCLGARHFYSSSCTAPVGPSPRTPLIVSIRAYESKALASSCIQSVSHTSSCMSFPRNIALRLSLCQGQVQGQPESPRQKVGGRCHGRKVSRRALQVLAPPGWDRQRRAEGPVTRHRTQGCSCPC